MKDVLLYQVLSVTVLQLRTVLLVLTLIMFAALLFLQSGSGIVAVLNKHTVSKLLLMLLAMFQIPFLPHCPADKLATTLLPNHMLSDSKLRDITPISILHTCVHVYFAFRLLGGAQVLAV